MKLKGKIAKRDDEQHLVFGWASVAEISDSQDDIISIGELERAAYKYVKDARLVGEMHSKMDVGQVVESMVFTPEKMETLGIEGVNPGWWLGIQITDSAVWDKIKSGQYKMFSIGGRAVREEIKHE